MVSENLQCRDTHHHRKMSKNMFKYSNSQNDRPFAKLFYYVRIMNVFHLQYSFKFHTNTHSKYLISIELHKPLQVYICCCTIVYLQYITYNRGKIRQVVTFLLLFKKSFSSITVKISTENPFQSLNNRFFAIIMVPKHSKRAFLISIA